MSEIKQGELTRQVGARIDATDADRLREVLNNEGRTYTAWLERHIRDDHERLTKRLAARAEKAAAAVILGANGATAQGGEQ